MANVKNITELPMAESAEGLNLIVNDNGSAKQIAASAVGAQADFNVTDENSPAFIKNKPGVAQPDWNENDESNAAFIKNKPFWVEENVSVEILPMTIYTLQEEMPGMYMAQIMNPLNIELDKTYQISYNNTIYTCKSVQPEEGIIALGNLSILDGPEFESTNEPFCIAINPNVGINIGAQDQEVSLSISVEGNFYHTIDPNYIKDMYYTERLENAEVLAEITKIPDEDNLFYIEESIAPLIENGSYIVTWNGTEYHCECFIEERLLILESEMFTILQSPDMIQERFNAIVEVYDGSESVTMSIIGAYDKIHKINPKYIPNEGYKTLTIGSYSHVEGGITTTVGAYSHAEGFNTFTTGYASHAEGEMTEAEGDSSHAEGIQTFATAYASHAEGAYTTAEGDYSHAEGESATATAYASHAEGMNTTAEGDYSHAEGNETTASGESSHAEGYQTTASGLYSHAEGNQTTASGDYSHAEGNLTKALGLHSHAEGLLTEASEQGAHAEGAGTFASGMLSHAEGTGTTASGVCSHAEGNATLASGLYSHVEGDTTLASGESSHAEGCITEATAYASHAEGCGTKASSSQQHTQGKFNIEDTNNIYAHIVGNGTDNDARSNAHTLDWSGNAWYAGTVECTGIILTSPNGTKYKISVADDGTLLATNTAIPI